jgi:hypothetical protein
VWTAEDLVSHNNPGDGLFIWQNDGNNHVISGVTCYRNGAQGIHHGAYTNHYRYKDVVVFDNWEDIRSAALGTNTSSQVWDGVWAETLTISHHSLERPGVVMTDLHVPGVKVDEGTTLKRGLYELHCAPGYDLDPSDFTILTINPATVITVFRSDGTSFEIRGS